ncbi:MAG: hypothetical protein KF873_01600 [Gemmataceae bacterium]|nr:hypothetical protein [Planctomycetia bacterium]MBX3397410.1 hypothetical protein [Gemmataceae bacterium]
MAPNEIVSEIRQIPFEPFRMHVVDGTSYDVVHPDQCIVLLTSVVVGLERVSEVEGFQRTIKIDCRLISRIEPIDRPAAPPRKGDPPTLTA